ncbi:MAG: hypothetical protein EOP45_17315 [Sphingobacteriaceae bacterium]|nr:MAG: hypothetical protein EOP45_17315 [Sphingobacteriaceae bacterium]
MTFDVDLVSQDVNAAREAIPEKNNVRMAQHAITKNALLHLSFIFDILSMISIFYICSRLVSIITMFINDASVASL